MSVGTYWKIRFKQKVTSIMYNIKIYKFKESPTFCPGAFTTDSNEFDASLDAAYHNDNPSEPICRFGMIGLLVSEDIKGFCFENLKWSQMFNLNLGVLDENEAVFLSDGFTDLNNVLAIEYPAGEFYSFILKRNISIADEVVAQYGKIKKCEAIIA